MTLAEELIELAGIKPPAILGTWIHTSNSSSLMLPKPWSHPLIHIWQVPEDPELAKEFESSGDTPIAGTWVIDFQAGREYFGPEGLPSRKAALIAINDIISGKRILTADEMSMNS